MATALDNIGREINNANMTLGEIKGLVASLMKKDVGPAKTVEDSTTPKQNQQEHLGKLQNLFETFTKDYNADVEEQKGFLQTIVDTLKEMTGLREGKVKDNSGTGKGKIVDKNGKIVSKEEKLTAKASDRFAKEFHKTIGTKGSGWVHDPYCEKVLNQILAAILNKDFEGPAVNAAGAAGNKRIAEVTSGAGATVGGGGDAVGEALDEVSKKDKEGKRIVGGWFRIGAKESLDDLYFMQNVLANINKMAIGLQNNFLGFNGFDMVVKGLSDEERKFTQEIRATAYEVAGVTKESKALQKTYEQIGKSSAETGMDRSQTQKFYMKALKSGVRDTKIALNLTKAQLNTERQIGVEAGTLNETFMAMAHAGRMNTAQIAQMGRGMRDVAKHTGITGDELAGVIKSSEQFTNNLRKAANLTASAVENIIEISAHAKKLGIANEMQPLMAAMTSTNNLMFEASKGTQALLLQAAGSVGRIDDLMKGTILKSKDGVNAMAKGFDNVLKQFGVESLDAVDNLSDEAKMNLNMQLKAAYGIELGDMRSVIETMREAGKGMAERLGEINKQRKLNLTTEERAALDEKERALKAGKSLSILTALSEATKGTGEGVEGMNQALAKFEKRKGEFEGDMNAMGQTWTNSGDAARQSIESALNEINVGRNKAGMEAVKIDSSDIEAALKDKDALALVMDRLSKGEQELATANKEQLDPMTAMEGHLRKINDNIRVYTQSLFSMMFNSVIGKLVAIVGVLTSIAVGIGYMGFNIVNTLQSISSLIGKMFPKLAAMFGKEAAEAAGKGAGHGATGATKVLTKGGGDKAAQEALKARLKAAQAERAAAKSFIGPRLPDGGITRAKVPPTGGSAFSKGFGRAEAAGEGFFKSLQRGFTGSVKEANAAFKGAWKTKLTSMGKTLESTTNAWGKSIGNAAELAGKAVEENPIKAYKKLVGDTWEATFDATRNGMESIKSGIRNGWDTTKKIAGQGLEKTTKIWGQGVEAAQGGWKAASKITASIAEKGAAGTAKALAGGVTKGVTTGFGALVKGSGKAGNALLKFAGATNPVGWAILGVMAAIDGLTGSMEAGARAGEIFGKAQEDVTLNEEYAAKSAGLLTGIINGLTLGILGWIVPLDKITDALARFNAKVPILTIALAPLVITLEALWGVIKGLALGIWEIVKGLWQGVMNILTPVFEGLSDIFSTIGSMFGGVSGKAGGLTKAFRDLGGIVGIISGAIKFVGTAIGWIFRAIGAVIGFILKAALKIVEGLTYALAPIIEVFVAVFDAVLEIGAGIGDVFIGLWDVVSGIGRAIYDIFSPIFGIFSSGEGAGIGFMDVIKGIATALGKTIGILVKIVFWPLMVIAKVLSGIGKLIQAVVKIFRGDFSGAGELVKSAVGGVLDALLWPFKEILSVAGTVGKTIFNIISGIFSVITTVFGWIASAIGVIVNGIASVVVPVFSWIGSVIGTVVGGIGSTIGAFVSGFMTVFEPIGEVFSNLWEGVKEIGSGLSEVFGVFYEIFSGIYEILSITAGLVYTEISAMVAPIGKFFSWVGSLFGGFSSDGEGFFKEFLGWVTAIGSVLGRVAGFFVKLLFRPLMILGSVLGAIGKIIQAVVKVLRGDFSGAGKLIGDAVMGIVNAIIWPFKEVAMYFYEFGSQILGNIAAPFVAVYNIVHAMVSGVIGAFQWLYDVIFGHSIVPDLIDGIIGLFAKLPGMIYGFIGKTISAIADMAFQIPDMIWSMSEKIIDFALSPFKKILNFFGAGFGDTAVGGVKAVMGFIFDLIVQPFRLLTKVISGIGKVVQAVGAIFSGDFSGAATLVKDAVMGILDTILAPFKKLGSWLYDNTIGAMGGFGSWLYDNTIGAMLNFGSKLYDVTIKPMAEIGTWLWDTLTGAFTKLMDWILSWIPGGGSIKTGAEAFSATEAENQKRVETEGSSISGGLGRTLGGITSLDVGKTLGGLGETGGAVLGGLKDAGGAVLNAINPFNWFEEGTRKVEQTGVGVLHKNEMVVPAKDVETLTAKGGGKFGGGESFLSDLGSTLSSGFTSLMDGSMLTGIGESITGGLTSIMDGSMLTGISESITGGLTSIMDGSMLTGVGESINSGLTSMLDGSMMSKVGGGIDYLTGSKIGSNVLGEGSMLNNMNKSVGSTLGVQSSKPPSAEAIETRMTAQETESAIDSARFLYEMHTLATTGKGLKVRMAKQGMNFEEGLDLSSMMIQLVSPSKTLGSDALSEPNLADMDMPWDESKLGPKPVMPEAGENALAPPVPATQAAAASLPTAVTDAGKELAQRTAATQPAGMEVVSPDLGDLTAESSEQTVLMAQMVELLQKFVDLAKPKSTIASSDGTEPGDTATRKAAHPPANYYRAPIGHVSQTAGKAVLNVGSQTT